MRLPQLQIYSTPGRIGIRAEEGRFQIQQVQAAIHIETTPPVIEVDSTPPVVLIDMTRTWDALNGGKPMRFWNRIYNQYGQFVQQAIQITVAEYNRIGDMTAGRSQVPAVARDRMEAERPKIKVYGEPSVNNISYEAKVARPEIHIQPGSTDIQVSPNKPRIHYQRGDLHVYMAQHPSVEIIPPSFNELV